MINPSPGTAMSISATCRYSTRKYSEDGAGDARLMRVMSGKACAGRKLTPVCVPDVATRGVIHPSWARDHADMLTGLLPAPPQLPAPMMHHMPTPFDRY